MKRFTIALLSVAAVLFVAGIATAADYDLDWSVQYMIDNSQTVLGVNQSDRPRNNRGLALSPSGNYLYAGYNNPSSGYCVRKIDLSETDYTQATVVNLTGATRGKAIAVDYLENVYLADGAVKIYDADLGTLEYTLSVSNVEGVATAYDNGQLALYTTNRSTGALSRYLVTTSGGDVTAATLDTSWGTGGSVTLSSNIRGVEVDSSGRVWVAGYGANAVYVVAGDGGSFSTISGVSTPLDVGFDGDTALITTEYGLNVKQFSVSTLLSSGSDIVAPLGDLKLTSSPATGGSGAIDCIAVVPGVGFYVSGDGINTADGKSTYGAIDGNSGYFNGDFYTDLNADDNDPILFAKVVPEPGTIVLLTMAGLGLLAYVWRRRRS